MNNTCAYCGKKKAVKLWKETKEYVCLSCRLSLLAQEFEQTESKEDSALVKYWSELLDTDEVIIDLDEKGDIYAAE